MSVGEPDWGIWYHKPVYYKVDYALKDLLVSSLHFLNMVNRISPKFLTLFLATWLRYFLKTFGFYKKNLLGAGRNMYFVCGEILFVGSNTDINAPTPGPQTDDELM